MLLLQQSGERGKQFHVLLLVFPRSPEHGDDIHRLTVVGVELDSLPRDAHRQNLTAEVVSVGVGTATPLPIPVDPSLPPNQIGEKLIGIPHLVVFAEEGGEFAKDIGLTIRLQLDDDIVHP
ncbi:MAG: hypothetical protein VX733_04910 [Candidatus Latescibacterota bacterium]|nr:hypothetical protein [Candidatus Latescibacterota bacterium]